MSRLQKKKGFDILINSFEKMKISLVIPSFYPAVIYGGPIFSSLNTCNELARFKGFEIWVSTTNTNMNSRLKVKKNEWQKLENCFYVKYYDETIVDKFSFALFFNIWRDIRQADVVHIQSIFNTPTPIALFFATFFNKPILLSPRGALGEWCLKNGNKLKKQWLKFIIQPFSNKIVWHATAKHEKNEILNIFPSAKVEIIPNGIEYELFQKTHHLTNNEFIEKFAKKNVKINKIIVSMGRLQKKKGFDILIDSFVKILEKHPIAKLFIAGQDEGEKINLVQQINEIGLENKVFLIGSISGQDKIDFLANADIFVLPSHNENFGNVYIESLAAGTPIIASRNTPWAEVEAEDCGRWVNNNIDETAEAILEVLNKDRSVMKANAKHLAIKYNWNNVANQFKNVFNGMVE